MKPASKVLSITTTVGSIDEAKAMAHALVERRLAACVQMEPGITSVYRWDGQVQEASEIRIVIKTLPELEPALARWMAENHPYELPQYTAHGVDASEAYATWVRKETAA